MTSCLEVHINYSIAVQKDSAEGEALSVLRKTSDGKVGTDREENPIGSEDVHSSIGKHYDMVRS